MNNCCQQTDHQYTIKTFLPLITIFMIILLITLARQIMNGFNIKEAMYDFMGSFFIIFGTLKIINLSGFAAAYSMYDLIAKHFTPYAYVYPFIELFLGISYMLRFQLPIINLITFILMIIGSIGVALELSHKKTIVCACLGAIFKVPMTYVTLAEDLIMALMAFIMLFF